ncbi:uncharacterized protein L203_100502 [Cryptococcus depauperatus CBS 7841]|uniref:ATP-dependent DNA helicase PIF1 n=1 Tax=Cryptococcus depauperatus CBS 7841 TaxID=1295531 RepID=A0A1E3HRY9_9TREE|nr:ATP-dependent DNA helicase PIF1 [Cryptococcus depauperatus CBS 7841]
MPIITAGTASSSNINPSSSFSRVNSFKRDWGDQEQVCTPSGETKNYNQSPTGARRKSNIRSAPDSAQPVLAAASINSEDETPSQRRRRAILAALNENREHCAPTPGSKPPSNHIPSPLSQTPYIQQKPEFSSMIKRPLPWEEETISSNKKAITTNESLAKKIEVLKPNTRTTKINIKQKVALSNEQQRVLSLVVDEGKSVFFTGSAGTGKSVLLREIITSLRRKYARNPDAVAVTASTGIAACNIGGVTLHSFGGVGLANEEPEILLKKLRLNKKASGRWTKTRVLIIDEVSMVDGTMFDKFCKLGQLIRKNPRPWGGIQVIVTGDFFQLPPVTKTGIAPKFAFEAEMWNETIGVSVNLTKVFRQKDQHFVDMLNEMRFGRLSPQSIASFKALARPLKFDDGIEPTVLFPRREDVDRANLCRLNQLETTGYTYPAIDTGKAEPKQREKLLSSFMAPRSIELKIDAQVMLIKNIDETLVNGSMGKVIGFTFKSMFSCDSMGRWAPDADLEELDEEERAKKLSLRNVLRQKFQASGASPLPVVRFKVAGGGGTRDLLIEMDSFKAELPNGEVQAQRSQLPLILAWAMSIHKSQGQTLERVKVDLGKVFEKGQAYVALSRAISLEGLQVTAFTAERVMAHHKVAAWSKTLKDLNV